jgi:hypothetical protein
MPTLGEIDPGRGTHVHTGNGLLGIVASLLALQTTSVSIAAGHPKTAKTNPCSDAVLWKAHHEDGDTTKEKGCLEAGTPIYPKNSGEESQYFKDAAVDHNCLIWPIIERDSSKLFAEVSGLIVKKNASKAKRVWMAKGNATYFAHWNHNDQGILFAAPELLEPNQLLAIEGEIRATSRKGTLVRIEDPSFRHFGGIVIRDGQVAQTVTHLIVTGIRLTSADTGYKISVLGRIVGASYWTSYSRPGTIDGELSTQEGETVELPKFKVDLVCFGPHS